MNNIYIPKGYKILNIVNESNIECLFEIEFDQHCKPGQFVQVSLPKIGEAPISITRINEKSIEILIRKVGKVTNAIFKLKVGDIIFLRGPFGNSFDVDAFEGKDLAIISGGSGIAPVRPLIEKFSKNKNFVLLAGFKDEKGILFEEEIREWKSVNENVYVTLDCENNICLVGFVTDHINRILEKINIKNCNVVVVGPPIMMKHTVNKLLENGVSEENIIVSFERNMSCAVGKCGHCKIDEVYVCLEGPVFKYPQAKTLLD